jgi:ketosteroid isomerase-like protein
VRTSWRILLLSLSVSACRAGPGVPGAPFAGSSLLAPLSDEEEAHDALLRSDLSRADSVAHLGYAAGLAAVLANDVVYLRGGLPLVRGREAAVAIAVAESIGSATTVRWQPVRAEASGDGRSGYTYGYTIYSTAQPGSPAVKIDRYIAFWRREEAGWRITAYAETYGAPPAAMTLPPAARRAVLPDLPMPPARGALEAVRSADVEFSKQATVLGTGEAFRRFAAEDAQVFSAPGEFISGPDAIMRSFAPAASGNSLVWHPVAGEVSRAGDLGFTVGNAVFTGHREDGGAQVGYSKYLTVWRKQHDGSWRYVVDGGSARPLEP